MSGIPSGYFFIRHVLTGLVLDVANNATRPGSRVIVWDRKNSVYDNQLWRYEEGYFVNKFSGLVLEVPGYEGGGKIAPGTRLTVNARRNPPESLNQLWAYNGQMLSPYDPKVAITAGDSAGDPAMVDGYQMDNPSSMWSFDFP